MDTSNLAHSLLEANAPTWKEVLGNEREKAYFKDLLSFVEGARASGKRIYPPNCDVFRSLQLTPFSEIEVVILGQDPYHGPGQAHGLSFSVKPGVPFPPSLQNIFKELVTDIGSPLPTTGCLEPWAKQGVLLLNTVLTVEEGQPNSHASRGWERFTDRVVKEVAHYHKGLVFMLWGSHAQQKAKNADLTGHLLINSPHPSPLSAHRGFFGSRPFSRANTYLEAQGKVPIEWALP